MSILLWHVVDSHTRGTSGWQQLRDKRQRAISIHLIDCSHLEDTPVEALRAITPVEEIRALNGSTDEQGRVWRICSTCASMIRHDRVLRSIFAGADLTY